MIRMKLAKLVEKPISGEWGTEGAGIKIIRSTNFTNEGILDLTEVVERAVPEAKVLKKKLRKGDIIIEKSGGSPTQPVGRVVFFEEEGEYLFSNFTSVLRPKAKLVSPKYLHYILLSAYKGGVTNYFQNKTTGIINLQLDRYLKTLEAPLPPYEIQCQIADALDKADAIRKRNQQILVKYDELAQSVFLEMFDFSGEYEEYTFQELADPSSKGTFTNGPFGSDLLTSELTDKGIPVIYIRDIRNGFFNWRSNVYVTPTKANSLKNSQVLPGDLLITKVGDPPGTAAIYPLECKMGIITQDVIRLRANTELVNPVFLKYWFNTQIGQIKLKPIMVEGTRMRFGLGDLKKTTIKVPPVELQERFAHIIEQLEAPKARIQVEHNRSEELFQSLLQRAYKGELFEVNKEKVEA